MKGKKVFNANEIDLLKSLIRQRNNADGAKQKSIRNQMRNLGFYGRDDWGINDCQVSDLENLIASGQIKVIGAAPSQAGKVLSAPKRIPKTDNTVKGFPPFVPEGAEILVLGTMPGVESLQKQEYYAKNGNAFWKIISHLYHDGLPFFTYKEKLDCLEAHHIALWDTLQFCERKGSLDSDITNGVPNDIDGLLTMFPTIRKIVFNGKKAASIYQPHIKSYIAISTSGAATKSFEEKLNDWKKALR